MNKKQYQAPQVEAMECKVEHGFAGSNEPQQVEQFTPGQSYDGSTLFS